MTNDISKLDPDTRRTIEEILENGLYYKSTTLGKDGWPYAYKQTADWKRYVVLVGGQEIEMRAKSPQHIEAEMKRKYVPGTRYEIYEISSHFILQGTA